MISIGNPVGAKAFIQHHLPKDIVAKIDLNSLRISNKTYVTPELKGLEDDLVFECKINQQPGYIYTIVEHQSTPDYLLPLRLIGYNITLIREFLQGKPEKTSWPIIINMCLYHGEEKPYPYSTDIYDYFVDPELAKNLKTLTECFLVDLTVMSDKEIEDSGILKHDGKNAKV